MTKFKEITDKNGKSHFVIQEGLPHQQAYRLMNVGDYMFDDTDRRYLVRERTWKREASGYKVTLSFLYSPE